MKSALVLLSVLVWVGWAAPLDRPPVYNYNWFVDDDASRNHYQHKEDRKDQLTKGEYNTLLPNNLVQNVKYTVRGDGGYSAVVTYSRGLDKIKTVSREARKLEAARTKAPTKPTTPRPTTTRPTTTRATTAKPTTKRLALRERRKKKFRNANLSEDQYLLYKI